MSFDHEKLDVYGLAIDFVARANDAVEALPRGRGLCQENKGVLDRVAQMLTKLIRAHQRA